MNRTIRTVLLAASVYRLCAQSFDAASIKTASIPAGVTVTAGAGLTAPRGAGIVIPRNIGRPGTDDPGRIHYPLISVRNLLRRAYDSHFEIAAPGWVDEGFVQVDATMPPDTTRGRFQRMLQNLITERYRLKYHIESKPIGGYAVVMAKNCSRLKESSERPDASEAPAGLLPGQRKTGADGFPIPPASIGPGFLFEGIAGDRARMIGQAKTMSEFANALGGMLDSKVVDSTSLPARYDITLTFAGHLGRAGIAPTFPENTRVSSESGHYPTSNRNLDSNWRPVKFRWK
jgi:uncharacterized protein (TIGR03435 family)